MSALDAPVADTEPDLDARAVVDEISAALRTPADVLDRTVTGAARERWLAAVRRVNSAAAAGHQQSFYLQQLLLSRIYELVMQIPDGETAEGSAVLHEVTRLLETATLAAEDRHIAPGLVESAPTEPKAYLSWLKRSARSHRVFKHAYYHEFIRDHAGVADLRNYVIQESVVDGRFDDLLAMMQVGTSGASKLEIANNFWDEMGNGEFSGVHTAMFEASASWARESVLAEHGIDPEILEFPEAYADACELLMYALRRRYLLRSLASIGLLEQTAPARFAATVAACRRLGLPDHVTRYQEVHVSVDEEHGKEWFDGVFVPIMEKNPAAVHELALGVVIRGNVASEFFNTVHQRLFGLG